MGEKFYIETNDIQMVCHCAFLKEYNLIIVSIDFRILDYALDIGQEPENLVKNHRKEFEFLSNNKNCEFTIRTESK